MGGSLRGGGGGAAARESSNRPACPRHSDWIFIAAMMQSQISCGSRPPTSTSLDGGGVRAFCAHGHRVEETSGAAGAGGTSFTCCLSMLLPVEARRLIIPVDARRLATSCPGGAWRFSTPAEVRLLLNIVVARCVVIVADMAARSVLDYREMSTVVK